MSLSMSVAAARRQAGWGWGLALRLELGVALGGLALILVAWLAFNWWILPRLDEWRPQIEAQASRALGHPVQIGQIAVHSAGWVPAFVLRDVVLRDADGREALRLPQGSAALSVPALLALRLRFAQLLIDDARLEVRRAVQGRWFVAGLDLASGSVGLDASRVADWFFEQQELVIRRGALRWMDEQRRAPPLQLSDVLLVVRNPGLRHELRLDATPPSDWGQRFSLRVLARSPLLARAGDWQRWTGSLCADLPQVDVTGLRQHVDLPVDLSPDLPADPPADTPADTPANTPADTPANTSTDPQQGQAALREWEDWDHGLPQAITLDAVLRRVSVRLAPTLAPLALAELSGHFVAPRSADGVPMPAPVSAPAPVTDINLAWLPQTVQLKTPELLAGGRRLAGSAREFHTSGRWDDPNVERAERKLLAPLPQGPAAAALTMAGPGPGAEAGATTGIPTGTATGTVTGTATGRP